MRKLAYGMAVALLLLSNSKALHAATGTLNDYNPWDVPIPDNTGASASTDLLLGGAPAGAVIAKVKVYYEIYHTYPGDLDVWLTFYDGGWHDYFLYRQGDLGSSDNIIETRDNIHAWDGMSPNQTWYLSVRDSVSVDRGDIGFFELWVTYETNAPPNAPYSEDPSDGATGVSRTANLDWSCSDPDGDTIYYTVYFEKNDSTPDVAIKNDSTGSNADPGTLDYDSHYYWRVKADDHNGGVMWSPTWDFYTEPVPVVGASVTNVSMNKTQVKRGVDAISATVTIRNTGNQNWTFYVAGSCIESGDTTWYNFTPARASRTLSPGQSGSVTLTWSPPGTAPVGSYGFYGKIFKHSSTVTLSPQGKWEGG